MATKEQLRELILSAKILQFCADLFAVFGIFLFMYIYFNHYSDNPTAAIRDPSFVVIILFPFIPAAVLAFLASKRRKKIKALLEQSGKTS